MKIAALLAIFCCANLASGEVHSFKVFYTGTTGINDIPAFVSLNYLDNEVMAYFDSRTKRYESKQSWMAGTLGHQYEEQQANIKMGAAGVFSTNLQILMDRFNQTGGVHIVQLMYGCQWDDETQAVDGFDQYGYDGEDFIALDLKNLRHIAPTPQSMITKNKWDSNSALLEQQKHYYTQICIEWLKKYVQYGSSTLGRKVAPEVSLLQKGSGVACHATGFYPEGVMITWKKDGVEMQDDVDVGETLPNEDGTFQKRAVLTVSPEERKKGQYSCEVTHKSGGPIVMVFEEASHLPIIIAVCVVAAVALVAGIVAVVIMKKKGYTKAPQSDTSSDTSNGAPKA